MARENQESITRWQEDTFGPTTLALAFERMDKEYTELRRALEEVTPATAARLADELADVQITMYRVAEAAFVNLAGATDFKMAINRAREWDVDAKGHGQHR